MDQQLNNSWSDYCAEYEKEYKVGKVLMQIEGRTGLILSEQQVFTVFQFVTVSLRLTDQTASVGICLVRPGKIEPFSKNLI